MLNTIWFYVTEGCNLRCKYCFNPKDIFDNPNTVTIENFKKIFDNIVFLNETLNKNGRLELILFGGEPTLFPDLIYNMVKYSFEKANGKIGYLLITNGVKLHEIKGIILELVKKYNLRIQFSLDTDPTKYSDRLYKRDIKKYNENINKSLDFLIENSIFFNIRATLTPDLIKDYVYNFKYFLSIFERNKKIKPSFTIFPEFLYYKWTEDHYNLLDKEAEKIVIYIKDYFNKNSVILDEGFLKRALKNIYYKKVLKRKNNPTSFCGFANSLFSVSPDGKIFPCHRVYNEKEMQIGDLLKNDVDYNKLEAIRSVYNNRLLVKPNPRINKKTCEECELNYACELLCPASNFTKDDNKLDLYCNYTFYHFNRIYNKYAEKHLWELYETNVTFKKQLSRLINVSR